MITSFNRMLFTPTISRIEFCGKRKYVGKWNTQKWRSIYRKKHTLGKKPLRLLVQEVSSISIYRAPSTDKPREDEEAQAVRAGCVCVHRTRWLLRRAELLCFQTLVNIHIPHSFDSESPPPLISHFIRLCSCFFTSGVTVSS